MSTLMVYAMKSKNKVESVDLKLNVLFCELFDISMPHLACDLVSELS